MVKIVRSYNLYLNSRQATIGGSSNNCTFNINPAITLMNRSNRFQVSIPFMEVPYSFNQLSDTFNSLQYLFTDGSGSFTRTITIPVGNYNISNFITVFNTALAVDIKTQRPSWTQSNLVMNYDSSTGHVTMILSPASTSILFYLSQNFVIALMLGFPQINQTVAYGSNLTSINKVCSNPINAIFLRSDSLKFSTSFEAIVAPYSQADILARIPVTTLPNSWLYYRNDNKVLLSNIEIASLNFYFSDNLDPNYVIDLNGIPFGLQIVFDEIEMEDNNAGLDRLGEGIVALPKPLIEERDKTLRELLELRTRLEKEIQDKREARQKKKEILQ
jgi:hypothetical protein